MAKEIMARGPLDATQQKAYSLLEEMIAQGTQIVIESNTPTDEQGGATETTEKILESINQIGPLNQSRFSVIECSETTDALDLLLDAIQITKRSNESILVFVEGASSARSTLRILKAKNASLEILDLSQRHSQKSLATNGLRADLIIATPESIHRQLLPEQFSLYRVIQRISSLWIFDMVEFRGLLGSNLFHILKRFELAAKDLGRDISLVGVGIELGDADRFACELFDCGGDQLAKIYLPPDRPGSISIGFIDPNIEVDPSSALTIASKLARIGWQGNLKTAVITSSRLKAELISNFIIESSSNIPAEDLVLYRGGYLGELRVELEERLLVDRVKIAVATSALARDLTRFDLVVLVGFPGTIARFRRDFQRISKAGGMIVLVASADQLDRWITRNPHEIITRKNEGAAINPFNKSVCHHQLIAASSERSITASSYLRGENGIREVTDSLEQLVAQSTLIKTPLGYQYVGSKQPTRNYGLRGYISRKYRMITTTGEVLEEINEDQIPTSAFIGAVYRHRRARFKIVAIDDDNSFIFVEKTEDQIYTKALIDSNYQFSKMRLLTSPSPGLWIGVADLFVTETHLGYETYSEAGALLGIQRNRLPSKELDTEAFFISFSDDATSDIETELLPGALHAMEHCAIGILPIVSICDRWDVGGVSFVASPGSANGLDLDEISGAVAIYDGYSGGVGISYATYEAQATLIASTLETLVNCPCTTGCPSCIVSPKCGNNNEPLSKRGALELTRLVADSLAGKRNLKGS